MKHEMSTAPGEGRPSQPSTVQLWAKVGTAGHYPESYHPLPYHLLDAGMVAQAMWDRFLPASSRDLLATAHVDATPSVRSST